MAWHINEEEQEKRKELTSFIYLYLCLLKNIFIL